MGYSPIGLHNHSLKSAANGPLQRNGTPLQVTGRLADQGSVTKSGTTEIKGNSRSDPLFGVDNQSGQIRAGTH